MDLGAAQATDGVEPRRQRAVFHDVKQFPHSVARARTVSGVHGRRLSSRETYFVTNFFRFHVNGRRSEADQFQLMAPSPTLEDRVDD